MTREERKEFNYWLHRRVNDKGKIEKQCSKCGVWLEENENNFYLMNKKKPELGFVTKCKSCTSKDNRVWGIAHWEILKRSFRKNHKKPERKAIEKQRNLIRKENGYYSDYQKKHPDKMMEYAKRHRHHDITPTEWRECLKIFEYKCAYCDMSEEEHQQKFGEVLHKDHVDHEGYNDVRNAVPGCKQCNSYKWQHDMETWFRQQEFFSEDRLNLINWWTTEGYKQYIEDKPPYIIKREKNDYNNKFHWNLWSMDEKRNMIEIINTKQTRKELDEDILDYLQKIKNNNIP